ncbi:amidohydrolase family protein [Klebsiella michiganensis]|nr:amidohydrolase family protein [Klebsiella michiganensis]
MTHPIIEALQVNEAQFVALRRRFHQQPEIGFEEHKTSEEVARLLGEWGYQVHRGLAGTGVVGTLRVGEGKKRLGLRADMDALPMQEMSGKAWAQPGPTVVFTAAATMAIPPRYCTPRNIWRAPGSLTAPCSLFFSLPRNYSTAVGSCWKTACLTSFPAMPFLACIICRGSPLAESACAMGR